MKVLGPQFENQICIKSVFFGHGQQMTAWQPDAETVALCHLSSILSITFTVYETQHVSDCVKRTPVTQKLQIRSSKLCPISKLHTDCIHYILIF